ncbi:MAG: 23S rRNA (uracil(1939)-C(5))-methyltransferase RlmD [Firmicutes bacterium]|uniref:23S rRNA m(5)U-1939 methyltransferase n=1 Tax=Melghirimyces thermohalophilus TaxID=1236220 RepID=A0A1G6IAU9_9BACL|nr:23S rRNA (uracil(1939)-C(5))-methyltransferase RlmD [Melghirimyces thermohalophilus]MDA8353517.1 23S rRNA (uracil(1939)-C(5))-methyltransferase RlmD [Bacillota bacterium]SDC03513.1 23S rRNA m(5)U-1939 methyltransferase [Melghirimyces thermohalophilus]
MPKQKPPVQPGDRIQLTLTGQTHTGDGVGKYDGFTVFVPLTVAGERVEAKVTKVKKTYAHARMEALLEASPARVDAPCPVFERCGGCQIQHIAYPAQLEAKRRQVANAFARIGGLEEVKVLPVLGMDQPWNYRNKAQVPFSGRRGRVKAGFFAAGSHEVVEFEHCMIQQPENDRAIQRVRELVKELGIPPYNEQKHRGIVRHTVVRTGVNTGEVMVVLVTNGLELPHRKRLVRELRERIPGLASVVQNIQTKRTNVVLGPENRLLWGEPVIHDTIGHVRFVISPHSFFQINPEQTEVLYEQVRRYAALSGRETVIDAYCGIGTIGLYLAQDAARILGVESIPQAVEDARRNAELNGIDHATFTAGPAEEVMPRWAEEGLHPNVIVVDPPRKGCAPEFLDAAVRTDPDRLVYVSCNPATLARDAAYLKEQGYVNRQVQPVDMFPHTSHVECVTVFRKQG